MLDNYGFIRYDLPRALPGVGVRYFTMPVLVNFPEEQSTRINTLGLRSAKTASVTARFELQLWDAQSGRIVWEDLSDLPVAKELIREHPVSFEEIIQAPWTNLIKQIPSETASRAQTENPTCIRSVATYRIYYGCKNLLGAT